MIYYDDMREAWVDSEDEDFLVTMTPEGCGEELDMTFETQEEFWRYYNNT